VVTTASLAQPFPDSSGHGIAAYKLLLSKLLLADGYSDVHGKEKVYGSIP
jgi:hypothetical protein